MPRQLPSPFEKRSLKVLVIESYPRWEYRYLRNALSRDPGVDVNCLVLSSWLEQSRWRQQRLHHCLPGWPRSTRPIRCRLLGDVGIDDSQLTEEQCRLLKGLVEQQASGLVFMPGWQGRQQSLLSTELADLYPVTLDEAQTTGWGSRTASHFELTELGRRSLLTKLADNSGREHSSLENLPGFQWYAQ